MNATLAVESYPEFDGGGVLWVPNNSFDRKPYFRNPRHSSFPDHGTDVGPLLLAIGCYDLRDQQCRKLHERAAGRQHGKHLDDLAEQQWRYHADHRHGLTYLAGDVLRYVRHEATVNRSNPQ